MNLILPIHSLFILSFLLIVFYSRKRIENVETKIYGYLMLVSLFNVILNIVGIYAGYNNGDLRFLYLLNHFDLPLYFWWASLLLMYLLYVYYNNIDIKKYKKFRNIILIGNTCFTLLSMVLKFEVVITDKAGFAIGTCVNFVYGLCGIYIVSCIITSISLIKKSNFKKTIPIFSFLLLGVIAAFIQKNIPSLIIVPAVIVFVELIMYFTIENPDIKLLEELHKSKEISDSANEEKTLFLYNMTQEIRGITEKINDDADVILDSKDWDETYDSARDIKAKTSEFTSMTNDILDVGSIDSANLKTYSNKYDIKNIIKQMVNIYSEACKKKELRFRTNIDHDIPDNLYGDGINLKEVLNTILENSVKYTSSGYVEFNVSTIIKNDICRLIFTIEDSGTGIKSEDINKIKISDSSLAKANKLITMMNGTMLISSDYGVGTKVKVILDQKIGETEATEVSKYESTFDNVSILSVDDSEAGLKIIEKLLKGTNVKLELASTGKEALDKVLIGKYDLIFLDEDLSQISGSELMQKFKEVRNFNTPVILLTKDNSYEYNEEYIKLGFSDYLLKPLKKEELLAKIDKYTKGDK